MNKIKIIILSLMVAAHAGRSMAQKVDENQMDQDVKIMESVLGQMFFRNHEIGFHKKQVSGNYIPGFGLIFKIPKYENYFLGANVSADTYAIIANPNSNMVMGQNVFAKNKMDSIRKVNDNYFKETIQSFFINYGDLISQLKPEERILVVYGSNIGMSEEEFVTNVFIQGRMKQEAIEKIESESKMVAQVDYRHILDFKSGKVNDGQLRKNIKLSKKPLNEATGQEFIILSSIFQRIYNQHAGSFGHRNFVSFEIIDGLGVIYEMSLHSWTARDLAKANKLLTVENRKIDEVKQQQKEDYQDFKLKLKQNLIKYGKTLKSLKDDEVLMLAIKLSDCVGCDKPEKLNLVVKASALKDYDQRKITMDQAVEQIMEKEVRSGNRW